MLLSIPSYIDHPDGRFIVENPMRYKWKGEVIEVPKGFITDFASIPRVVRMFITVNDRHKRPALLHDYLYYRGGEIGNLVYTRYDADKAFLHFMKDVGVSVWKRHTMYRAVRMFGWMSKSWR